MAKPKYKKTYLIDRAKWLNGWLLNQLDNYIDSKLVEPNTGFMCCLGMVCLQEGIPKSKINNMPAPSTISATIPLRQRRRLERMSFLNEDGSDTVFASQAMETNDEKEYTHKEREDELKSLAAAEGIKFTFVGRYPTKKDIAKLKERL